MYGFLWRVLPGPWWVRAGLCAVLFVSVIMLCFTVVFPAIAPYVPFNDASVGDE